MNPFIRREPIDEAACRAWTADIKAARADYAAHPTTSCRAVIRTDGEAIPCGRLAVDADTCRGCKQRRTTDAKRMRQVRAAKAVAA